MRSTCKFFIFLPILFFSFFLSLSAHAILNLELTKGVAGAIPIAVVPFAMSDAGAPQPIANIITQDLQNSGRFKVYGRDVLKELPSKVSQVSVPYFRRLGAGHVVIGDVTSSGNQYHISFQLLDLYGGNKTVNVILDKKLTASQNELRKAAHHISNLIFEKLTGIPGIFNTKLAYIVVNRSNETSTSYRLEVSDQDGYNPRPLLTSPEPIMSPAWAPSGKEIAYVSFENHRANIFIQDVVTGERRLLTHFPGINGAPAWSPDGKKLALVLSKSGSPNIYVMDIASKQLRQITHDYYINTEPAWSPNGRSLLFTSNRSGGTQVFQVNLSNPNPTRISFAGDYNARASFTRDGKYVAMIHRVSGIYNVALLDLDTGITRILSNKVIDSTSPSIAPNGSMILYETLYNGRNVLAMVSSDGSIQLRLPTRSGEAQDPSWSPV